MKHCSTKTDSVVLHEIGSRIVQHRLQRNWTQEALAIESGVSKRTVERLESGNSVQLASLIRICRALQLLDGMSAWIPEAKPGPVEQLRSEGKKRKRASAKNDGKRSSRKSGNNPDDTWTWGDDNAPVGG